MEKNLNCPFCLGLNTATFGITKKGKPYISCENCLTRAFINRPVGLMGLFFFSNIAIRNFRENIIEECRQRNLMGEQIFARIVQGAQKQAMVESLINIGTKVGVGAIKSVFSK